MEYKWKWHIRWFYLQINRNTKKQDKKETNPLFYIQQQKHKHTQAHTHTGAEGPVRTRGAAPTQLSPCPFCLGDPVTVGWIQIWTTEMIYSAPTSGQTDVMMCSVVQHR